MQELKKFELSTELLGLPFGCYHGIFNNDSIIDSDQIEQDFEEGYIEYDSNYFWENFDNDLYMGYVQSAIDDYLQDVKKDLADNDLIFIERINCVGWDSPKYYNFRDDNFHIDIYMNDRQFIKLFEIAAENKDDFDKFLHENFSSRDGFISFTSNNYPEWRAEMFEEKIQAVAAIMQYILHCIHGIEFGYMQDGYMNGFYYTEVVDKTKLNDFKEDLENGYILDTDLEPWQIKLAENHLNVQKQCEDLYLFHDVETATDVIHKKYEDYLTRELVRNRVMKYFNSIDSQTMEFAF